MVKRHYSEEGAHPGPDQPIEFEGKEIRLDLPMEATKINDKWTLIPLIDPMVGMTIDSNYSSNYQYLPLPLVLDNQERGGQLSSGH